MPFQRTIAQRITCTGVGLHSGEPVELALCPAEPDTGIVFLGRTGSRLVEIPARSEHICDTRNATSLESEGVRIATVEHLMAALYGLGVDNLRVEVQGGELPGMDGSAESFARLVRSAGLLPQATPRRLMVVRRPVRLEEGPRAIHFEPCRRGLRIDCGVDFAHPAIGRQRLELLELSPAVFEAELARARTFGFLDQVESLRRDGLARGASLENTIVLGDEGVVNPSGLRWPDEVVRHKLVDLLGDLALLGHRLQARVRVERGGHSLHRAGLEKLRATPDAWCLEDDPGYRRAPAATELASPA